jgi:hypothetical protein
VTIEYKIKFENGGVSITQQVNTDDSPGNGNAQGTGDSMTQLGVSYPVTQAAAGQAAGRGGNAPGDIGSGGNAPGDIGSGGNAPGDIGSGGGLPAQGQIIVFGPIVVDATGRIQGSLNGPSSIQQQEEK